MTVAWFDTPATRLSRFARQAGTWARRFSHAAVQPHKAAIGRLAEMPLTVLGVGFIDFAGFHYIHMVGWLVTGISLLWIERVIADPPDYGGNE